MTPTRPAVLDQARELREVLETLAAALGRGEASAVLAAEPALQAAVGAVAAVPGRLSADDRAAMAEELHRARTALARCRAIGAATADLTGVTLDVLGGAGSYSRHGAGQPRAPRGRDLHARV